MTSYIHILSISVKKNRVVRKPGMKWNGMERNIIFLFLNNQERNIGKHGMEHCITWNGIFIKDIFLMKTLMKY